MLFCAPQLSVAPSITVSNLFQAPRIADPASQTEERLESEAHFAVVLLLDIPSTLPRIDFISKLWWTPFAGTSINPFTRYRALDVGEDEISNNSPVAEFGAALEILRASATGGWLELGIDVLSQFAPSARPDAGGAYSHNLNLEIGTRLAVFNWLPSDNWLRNVKLYAALDYLATGLPEEGDVVPRGERLFLDDASPWSFWTGLKVPLAPIAPRSE